MLTGMNRRREQIAARREKGTARIDTRPKNRWDVQAGMTGVHRDMRGNVISGKTAEGKFIGGKKSGKRRLGDASSHPDKERRTPATGKWEKPYNQAPMKQDAPMAKEKKPMVKKAPMPRAEGPMIPKGTKDASGRDMRTGIKDVQQPFEKDRIAKERKSWRERMLGYTDTKSMARDPYPRGDKWSQPVAVTRKGVSTGV